MTNKTALMLAQEIRWAEERRHLSAFIDLLSAANLAVEAMSHAEINTDLANKINYSTALTSLRSAIAHAEGRNE